MMQSFTEKNSEVLFDISKEWGDRLLKLIDAIDQIKQNLIVNKELIINYSERLRALYFLLFAKMTPAERSLQKRYDLKLSNKTIKVFSVRMVKDEYGSLTEQKVLNKSNFNKVKNILEDREMSLNICLERLGLTARHKEPQIR